MSFNTNLSAEGQQAPDQSAAAIKYLRQGWDAQAFLILSEAGSEKNPAARFALGICHVRAGELSFAIPCFEQALQLLRGAPQAISKGIGENSETHLSLTKKQIEDAIYLTPMDADFCSRFPRAAEQTVTMALVHVYKQKGMVEQAQRLASGLIGPAFEEYRKRLNE